MKFETEEKTYEINRFRQRLFYSFLLLAFLIVIFIVEKDTPHKLTTWFLIIAFTSFILLHIFILSKYSWYLILLCWFSLNIILLNYTWVYVILLGQEGGVNNLLEAIIVLIVMFIPSGLLTVWLFYFKPKYKL